jgi:hypothetical protein
MPYGAEEGTYVHLLALTRAASKQLYIYPIWIYEASKGGFQPQP